jgi:hypothetical protein
MPGAYQTEARHGTSFDRAEEATLFAAFVFTQEGVVWRGRISLLIGDDVIVILREWRDILSLILFKITLFIRVQKMYSILLC